MGNKLTITVEPADAELVRRMKRFSSNGNWLTANGATLFDQHRGRFLAVSEGEVFVADSRNEARRLAKEKHPADEPLIQYIPLEKMERIYAC